MASTLPLSSPPKTLCILRLSALGDVTHVMPIIRTIQKHWPETRITWIIGHFEHKLVGDLEGVEFITFKKKDKVFKARKEMAEALGKRKFDVLLNMQVAMRSNLVSTQIKADVRLGYDRGRSKDFHGIFINHRIPERKGEHVVECFFSFLERLGLAKQEMSWNIPIPQEASGFARQHLDSNRPNLIISPCSSHELRNWTPDRYAEAADYAISRYGVHVVITGGPTPLEEAMGKAIQNAMRHDALNLVGKDTIKRLMAMIALADLVISPDSGPAHMASAANTPVIGLYAASNVHRSGPFRFIDLCVDRYHDAAMKFKKKPGADLKWGTKLEYEGVMDLITVEDVCKKVDEWADAQGIAALK